MPNVILSEGYSVQHLFFQTLSFQVEMTCYSYVDKTLRWIWAESYDTCDIHVNSVNPEDMIRTSCKLICKINTIWGWPAEKVQQFFVVIHKNMNMNL